MSGEDPAPSPPPLTPETLRAIYAHALDGYPEEVCGLVIGDGVRRCVNNQGALHAADPERHPRDARTAYSLGDKDLLFVAKSERSPTPVRVIYHSHVDVGAYFSAEDVLHALFDGEPAFPWIDWLVVDARVDGARGAKLFRFVRGEFTEIIAFDEKGDPR
jgi:proteasome lid subunit RPN8/RPN11